MIYIAIFIVDGNILVPENVLCTYIQVFFYYVSIVYTDQIPTSSWGNLPTSLKYEIYCKFKSDFWEKFLKNWILNIGVKICGFWNNCDCDDFRYTNNQ